MAGDMGKAVSFYESTGLTLKQRRDNRYAMMSDPGTTIGLHPPGETGTNSVLYPLDL